MQIYQCVLCEQCPKLVWYKRSRAACVQKGPKHSHQLKLSLWGGSFPVPSLMTHVSPSEQQFEVCIGKDLSWHASSSLGIATSYFRASMIPSIFTRVVVVPWFSFALNWKRTSADWLCTCCWLDRVTGTSGEYSDKLCVLQIWSVEFLRVLGSQSGIVCGNLLL